MKILFKTVRYQGRGRDRFQHSSAVLPGKGGWIEQRATSRSWEVTGEGQWGPGQRSQLTYEGQAGCHFLYLCKELTPIGGLEETVA